MILRARAFLSGRLSAHQRDSFGRQDGSGSRPTSSRPAPMEIGATDTAMGSRRRRGVGSKFLTIQPNQETGQAQSPVADAVDVQGERRGRGPRAEPEAGPDRGGQRPVDADPAPLDSGRQPREAALPGEELGEVLLGDPEPLHREGAHVQQIDHPGCGQSARIDQDPVRPDPHRARCGAVGLRRANSPTRADSASSVTWVDLAREQGVVPVVEGHPQIPARRARHRPGALPLRAGAAPRAARG